MDRRGHRDPAMSRAEGSSTNTLGLATSPYLRQHADNPVHWQQWTPEALGEAAARDVPILLSIGYAACHWCHVMAHESFEDDEVAAAMNAGFVCIKVDREERPDIDAVYMNATVALTGHGGWPLTCFLTPDGRPLSCSCFRRSGPPGGNAAVRWRRRPTASRANCGRWPRDSAGRPVPDPSWCLRCVTTPSPRCWPIRTRCAADSVVRPSSHRRRFSRRCCAITRSPGRRKRWRRCRGPAMRWHAAASTTNSAAASPVTASTTLGWYRISRRCCTTMRCCYARTRTGHDGPPIRWRIGWPPRRRASCLTTLAAEKAACSSRRWTQTPTVARARPTSGPRSS